MEDNPFSRGNVVVVSFAEDSKAFEALATLKQLDAQGQVDVVDVAVVTRDDDGRVRVKDEAADDSAVGTASGGLIGVLVGILGGPLGVLIGGATGLLLGSLYDVVDADDTDSILSQASKSVQVGRTTLLAQLVEPSTEVVDSAMASLTGTVVRRPIFEVEDEIARAQEAQRDAKNAARAKLREARHEKNREEAQAKVEELKAKLHREKKPATTTS
jgi:uncharacterized membrane protein